MQRIELDITYVNAHIHNIYMSGVHTYMYVYNIYLCKLP